MIQTYPADPIQYWQEDQSLLQQFKTAFPSVENKYLLFDVDVGGFNNIRMQLEYVAILAAITGRTLVLPAPSPWYLINWGPIQREGDIGGVSNHAEFFDIGALNRFIDVITTAEFIDREKDNMNIPGSFSGFGTFDIGGESAEDKKELREHWKGWLSINGRPSFWNPLNNLIYHPGTTAVLESLAHPDRRFIDSRSPVWLDKDTNDAPILYTPCRPANGVRQLGQVSRLVAFADSNHERLIRALLKHGMRYVPGIFQIAKSFIDKLGQYSYSSLHLRRNDIQYQVSRAAPATTATNIDKILLPGEPLYLATDEIDETYFRDLKVQRPVYRFTDLASLPGVNNDPLESTPHKLIGCVEQVICAAGRAFVGTPFSSFSTYITRLHGYLDAPDLAEYSHTQLAETKTRDFGFSEKSLRGKAYLREDPVLWEDADLNEPIYSVSCTDTTNYIHWQCELLEYSWKEVAQTGELIRLVALKEDEVAPEHRYTSVIPTAYTNVHPDTGDRYAPYNRLYSLKQWLDEEDVHGTVLILDPDCVFRKRITERVKPGSPVAQRWRGFGVGKNMRNAIPKVSDVDLDSLQDVTWPALVHTEDLRRLMPRWIELTAYIRKEVKGWESDMMAFVVAAAEMGITFTDKHIAAVLNWPEEEHQEAPIIHYCQAVQKKDGSRLWYKQGYQPWAETGADPSAAMLPYCGDLVAILNKYIDLRTVKKHAYTVRDNISDTLSVSSDFIVKAYLEHGKTLEFVCERGDETMQALFHVLGENTNDPGSTDRLVTIPNAGKNYYFRRSSLIGLETIPR